MSKAWVKQSACEGKERFAGFTLAAKVAKRLAQRNDVKAMPYQCPHCHGYHIGSRDYVRSNARPRSRP